MARIPDATQLGVRPLPSNRVSVAPDQSGQILAEGAARVAQQLGQHFEQKREKKDALRYQAARSALLQAHIAASNELEDVEDFTSWQQTYDERMAKARDKASELLTDPSDRAQFEIEAKLELARGSDKIRDKVRAREIDVDRAGLQAMLESNRDAVLESTDPEIRQALIESTKAAIAAAEQKGSLSAIEAEHMDSTWTRDLAEGSVVMLPPDARAEILANPEGTLAEMLSPDRRKVLLRSAMEENKVTRNRAASQAESDRIMADFEDRGAALAEARRITDPDVRSLTVADINSRFREIDAIETERNAERLDEAATIIEEGGQVTDISPRTWAELSIPQRQALEVRQRQVQTGEEPVNDDARYYEWTQMSQEKQAETNLLDPYWRANLDNAHYERAVARQQAIVDSREGNKDATARLTSAVTLQQRIENSLLSGANPLFKSKPSAKDAGPSRRWATIEFAISQRVEQESEAKGRKLTPQEIQANVDAVVMDRYFVEEWGRDPERFGVELTPDEVESAYVPYDRIPNSARSRLENYARSLGFEPGEDTIGKAYAAAKLGMGNERIDEILRDN